MVKEGIVLGHKISKSGIEVDRAKIDVIAKPPYPTNVKGVRSFLGHAGFYLRFIKDFSKISRPITQLLIKDAKFTFSNEWAVLGQRIDKNSARYIMQDAKPRLIRWVLLLQEFTIKIKDKKGTVNLDADHLSRLENPDLETLNEEAIQDSFPDEYLMAVRVNEAVEDPWKFFSRFGVLTTVISDRGIHFCNSFLEKTLRKYGVTHRLAIPYHLQISGQTINVEKHYWKSNNDSKREELEWENLSLNDWMRIRYGKICKMTGERIRKDYWRERFGDEGDDLEENLEDPEECEEDKANTILGVIHDKLNNDWFNNTSEDEDDLERILDYLKPRSYDGFNNLDDEAYNKRSVSRNDANVPHWPSRKDGTCVEWWIYPYSLLQGENEKEDPLQKEGQTDQTLRMLLPKEDNVNTGKQGLGFKNQNDDVNPSLLNKAKELAPCLYNIYEMGKDLLSDHKIISEEELKCEAEKCLKVKQRKSLLSYHGFVYADTQFEEPPKVHLKRRNVNLKKTFGTNLKFERTFGTSSTERS
ncbi:reverse transcriptase domain-containing protein [Tanacetum coccineum]|uniref:Reverse transcriptase domain-containing protein n=1 Tax=Tanacetum coccineum TaxID=301880 RepID=A0ABQ5JB74_9ASTR